MILGLMTESELDRMNGIDSPYPKFWIPCHWAAQLVVKAKKDGKLENDEPIIEVNELAYQVATITVTLLCWLVPPSRAMLITWMNEFSFSLKSVTI